MDNSGIVQKISLIALKTYVLTWLLWQHLAQYLCEKMIFYCIYVESKSPRN